MDSSQSHWGGLNAFYWYQIFALDSANVELLQTIIVEKQYNQINVLWWNGEKGSRLKLSLGWPSYRRASGTNQPIKA